jgi:intracellular sulfur oxidation DsrE/DsrF family protein
MSLDRRRVFGRLAALVAGGLAPGAGGASAAASPQGLPRVVYHLSDADKVLFVLGNIQNHFKGMGGVDKVVIALVAHGPALAAFKIGRTDIDLERQLALAAKDGVALLACGNTLDGLKLTVADLLPGFSRVNEGGVVRLARLQAEGYAYLRP